MELVEHGTVAVIGGLLYVCVELAFRRRSHWTMFFLGGVCFWAVGMLDRAAPGLALPAQAMLGAALITALELAAGLLVNVRLGWNVWDYGDRPLNYRGQVCLPFFLLWIPLALSAVFADDLLRLVLFHRPPPIYHWGF